MKIIAQIALCSTFVLGAGVVAAQTPPPANLEWKTLDLMAFGIDYAGFNQAPVAQKKIAKSIWDGTYNRLPKQAGQPPAAFVIQATVETPDRVYVFSSMSAASAIYPVCEDAANSAAPQTPIYTICPLRVVIQNKITGAETKQDFPRYCVIYSNDPDNPKSKNYAQVAVDQKNKTAYYRVVMYGKPAPECNRSIKLI